MQVVGLFYNHKLLHGTKNENIYTYISETNYVSREYSVAAILLLQFMVLISLVSVLNLLYFYTSTFRSICAYYYYNYYKLYCHCYYQYRRCHYNNNHHHRQRREDSGCTLGRKTEKFCVNFRQC